MLLFVPTLYHAGKALVNICSWNFHTPFTEEKPSLHTGRCPLKMALPCGKQEVLPWKDIAFPAFSLAKLLQNCYHILAKLLFRFHNKRPNVRCQRTPRCEIFPLLPLSLAIPPEMEYNTDIPYYIRKRGKGYDSSHCHVQIQGVCQRKI